MLDSIVGPSYANLMTDDDVFGSIIGYMNPIPAPQRVAVAEPKSIVEDITPKDSPWAAQGESLGNGSTVVPVPEKVSYADAQIQEIEVTKIVPNPFSRERFLIQRV